MLDPLRKACQSKRLKLNTVGSMTPFVNAEGEVYLIVYCLKFPDDKAVEFSMDQQTPTRKVVTIPPLAFSSLLASPARQHERILLFFLDGISKYWHLEQIGRASCRERVCH